MGFDGVNKEIPLAITGARTVVAAVAKKPQSFDERHNKLFHGRPLEIVVKEDFSVMTEDNRTEFKEHIPTKVASRLIVMGKD